MTRYAKGGDLHLAYEVAGEGAVDLLLVPDGIVPIEAMDAEPSYAAFLERLASYSRLIRFDRRGIGLSDPVTTPPTLEQWADDARIVLDAVGSERAALLGIAEGGFVATFFAASLPERTAALVLVNATPGLRVIPEPGAAAASIERLQLSVDEGWGTDTSGASDFAPSRAADPTFHAWLAAAHRQAASPAMASVMWDVLHYSDIRDVLPAVRVPALVVHRAGNRWLRPENGRYLAEHIPGARYVEVPGDDHPPYLGDSEAVLGEIEEFLTGARRPPEPARVLAAVVFIDIVGSTELAANLGDTRWRALLEEFRAIVRAELARYSGQERDTAGDGFLVTFDGPARAVSCATAALDAVRPLELELRAGVHVGECELVSDGIAGIAVHIAARITAEADPGEVLVSRTVPDLVAGSGLVFAGRGVRELRGVPGAWELYAVAR